jgi:hypothetical protein
MSCQTNHSTTPFYSEDEDLNLGFDDEGHYRCPDYILIKSPYEGGQPFAISPVRRDE